MQNKVRIPPHSLQAEQSVLGALLIDKDSVIEIASFLRSKHFYEDKHVKIFKSIVDLYENRDPIDVVTVSEKLKSIRALKKIRLCCFMV